ncbi:MULTISPECIES: fumarate reductase cytochrome b subunit [unclassified Colwellia]|uniref:fumarate reductase cytochrome b subunit n=1 Tax=unclassified Colwellia TaxID=196834 RepID=UPI0015F74782|nr:MULTISPECIES: fumarate reductase cytochrome b subunit [unclassified Colwellia]MBA6379852.1 fumarate reductase cytochrome b subunit [Colwellia sp. BRX10-7]MBA6386578.1 fumarate reductase cytochrome b subunit [Colwellia sp. BRX10-2]MBA6401688.1 fumarate reductase cytochrome b subunit [Colwellia sp. BRX10-5]MBA6406279.1 fumarate reductase cytochrome b subunit [Colwellia sp. BRX10-1]
MITKINRWPARLDLIQSTTGLILALFMWAHMFFVSSILISHDAMYWVSKMFEGEPILGEPYPILVSIVALIIFTFIFIHAALALRKFPTKEKEITALHLHLARFKHGDTLLWYVQVLTGFLLFFLASIHLYQLMLHPADIGPYASSDRVWSGRMWPLYLILLFVVEIHGGIGLYRLAMKWGWFVGKDIKKGRKRLQRLKWALTLFFLMLGLTTLQAYIKIGYEHAGKVGERYVPANKVLLQPSKKLPE